MKINPDIFKAYDIRGIYRDGVSEDLAFLLGQAFVEFICKKRRKRLRVVVARDNRLSSPSLFKALSRGILRAGADIVDIGLSTTPMFYFAVAYYGFDGGIMITSSHNPPQYNGFKMVREKSIPISGNSGLQDIKDLVLRNEFVSKERGKVIKKKVITDYVSFNLKDFKTSDFPKIKIVVDTANSVSGVVIPHFFEKLPIKIRHLFKKLEGSFPNHNPDPLKVKNLEFLQKEVLKEKADLGIAFDGDGDRIVFITENGEIITGDIITALIADLILKEKPGLKIMYDITSSMIVKEIIEKRKGIPLESTRGHSLIKEKMRKEEVFFAGEFSGHYYSSEHYFCDCPFLVLFFVLREIYKTKKTLSQLVKSFKKYYHSEEINFRVKDKKKVLRDIEKKYTGKISKTDGVKISFKDWWFNLRPSNTEPVIRLIAEAKTKELLKEKEKELIFFIEKYGSLY
jgi:phosphomannomutase